MPTKAVKAVTSEKDLAAMDSQALRKRRPTPYTPTLHRLEPIDCVTNKPIPQNFRIHQDADFSCTSYSPSSFLSSRSASPETDGSIDRVSRCDDDDDGVFRFSWPDEANGSVSTNPSCQDFGKGKGTFQGMADDWFKTPDFVISASPLLPTPSPEAAEKAEYMASRKDLGLQSTPYQMKVPRMIGHQGPFRSRKQEDLPGLNFSLVFPASPPPTHDDKEAALLEMTAGNQDFDDWRRFTPAQRQILQTKMAQQFSTWNFDDAAVARDEHTDLASIFTSETLDPKDQVLACVAKQCHDDDETTCPETAIEPSQGDEKVTEAIGAVAADQCKLKSGSTSPDGGIADDNQRYIENKESRELSSCGQKIPQYPRPGKKFSAGLSQFLQGVGF
ncbi:hypothetical protein K431DRAFT_343764 [Polychaeton citri CBS 116435]|uniref:Uncharacterized protein n=1 Tax=Polychaeton citri CBS 116435 TaxID=1314669 RepID=A0A9P4UQS7_9PEZI|nr:hypothetical protein K431DRAFT_343764 [Polychaeton citri CBS 116435]